MKARLIPLFLYCTILGGCFAPYDYSDQEYPSFEQRKEQERLNLEQQNTQRRQSYIDSHPDLSDQMRDDILAGIIRLGMTKEQAEASWGKPYDINKSVYAFGVNEQWVYGEYGSSYLYFEDGILTSWQN